MLTRLERIDRDSGVRSQRGRDDHTVYRAVFQKGAVVGEKLGIRDHRRCRPKIHLVGVAQCHDPGVGDVPEHGQVILPARAASDERDPCLSPGLRCGLGFLWRTGLQPGHCSQKRCSSPELFEELPFAVIYCFCHSSNIIISCQKTAPRLRGIRRAVRRAARMAQPSGPC